MAELPWFVGAWKRRSIVVPGGEATEPCEAWWVQASELFVDVRVTRPGHHDNGLPFSSSRCFAGRFETRADGGVRWHVEMDSDGETPRSDGAALGSLRLDPHDPTVMVEDAPGRFVEEWVRELPLGEVDVVCGDGLIGVRVGGVRAAAWLCNGQPVGRVWSSSWSHAVGDVEALPAMLVDWVSSA